MLSTTKYLVSLLTATLFAVLWSAAHAQSDGPTTSGQTALDRYVARKDPAYKWEIANAFKDQRVKTYLLRLTSQTWRSDQEVNAPVWTHWLLVNVPDSLYQDTALLLIAGGANNDPTPEAADPLTRDLALATGSVTAMLYQVPNQPLSFTGEGGSDRVEDAIIAWSWDKYLATGDETWPAQLPMVNSVVRAMDAIQEFMLSTEGGEFPLQDFFLTGASKRGWTAWLTAAVDPRVMGIAPLVIDVLNMRENIRLHHAAYGFYAPTLRDYEAAGIMDRMETPATNALIQIVDPFAYRDRLDMPKLLIHAAGDQFFLPDSSRLYFSRLRAPKYLRYIPNADHSLQNTNVRESLLGFYRAVLNDMPLPTFDWQLEPGGALRVFTRVDPLEVNLWQADNPAARDFRLETIGPAWTKTSLPYQDDGIYRADPGAPPTGWRAYFLEVVFDSGFPEPYIFTTDVNVAPATLPFAANDDQPTTETAPLQDLDDAIESVSAPRG